MFGKYEPFECGGKDCHRIIPEANHLLGHEVICSECGFDNGRIEMSTYDRTLDDGFMVRCSDYDEHGEPLVRLIAGGIKMSIRSKLTYAREVVRVFFTNLYIEWHNIRLENKPRKWTAVKTGGGGIVPLGKVSQKQAIANVTKFGSIDFVDTEVAKIMYSDIYKT